MKEILTTFEAAKLCHVSYNTIKNWIKRGILDAYRTAGGHLRIRTTNLEIFCREHSIPMDKQADPSLRKVLVIDDEEAIRVALQETLTQYSEKLDIYTAADGFEAGSLMESVKPDLVMLDLVMPGMDGFKVCQSIRRSPALRHVKIAVLTGFPSDRNFERATELGADVCLAKPIDRALLFESIKSLLEPSRGVRGRRRKKAKRKK
ncbi:MAG: response regulator [Pseudomonadota bacterium]